MIRHALPRLRQSLTASARAFSMLSRATIAQPDSEWANAPHAVPKKLISVGHGEPLAHEACALDTAALRVSCDQDMPHLLVALE